MTSSSDETETRLVLAHEYFRCDQAFLDFAELAVANIGGESNKRLRLKMFDAYSRFLHHLYEFYHGIMKLQHNKMRFANRIDSAVQDEVKLIMRNRRNRIRQGRAPSYENDLSYYEEPVPTDFAKHFRKTRNCVAHADAKRAGADGALTLPEFYEQYHRYVLLLHEEAEFLWKVDTESFDWGEIEAFDLAVHFEPDGSPFIVRLYGRIRNWVFQRQLQSAIRSQR